MVAAVDDDMNIEFEEFLKLVKGGKKSSKKMMAHSFAKGNVEAN